MAKIVLKVKDEKELVSFFQQAKDSGFKASLITDAGKTVVAPGTKTCIAIGPDEEEKIEQFKEYDVEATIVKISPRGKFVKIDQGLSGDFAKGMKVDIYKADYFGGNILAASGVVYKVKVDSAIVKITKKYRKMKIEKGFVVRGY